MIEGQLDALERALASADLEAIGQTSQGLQQSLSDAVTEFRHARQQGRQAFDEPLRQRLMLAQSRVQQQWAQAHKASASAERVLRILLPQEDAVTYGNPAAATALNAYR